MVCVLVCFVGLVGVDRAVTIDTAGRAPLLAVSRSPRAPSCRFVEVGWGVLRAVHRHCLQKGQLWLWEGESVAQ